MPMRARAEVLALHAKAQNDTRRADDAGLAAAKAWAKNAQEQEEVRSAVQRGREEAADLRLQQAQAHQKAVETHAAAVSRRAEKELMLERERQANAARERAATEKMLALREHSEQMRLMKGIDAQVRAERRAEIEAEMRREAERKQRAEDAEAKRQADAKALIDRVQREEAERLQQQRESRDAVAREDAERAAKLNDTRNVLKLQNDAKLRIERELREKIEAELRNDGNNGNDGNDGGTVDDNSNTQNAVGGPTGLKAKAKTKAKNKTKSKAKTHVKDTTKTKANAMDPADNAAPSSALDGGLADHAMQVEARIREEIKQKHEREAARREYEAKLRARLESAAKEEVDQMRAKQEREDAERAKAEARLDAYRAQIEQQMRAEVEAAARAQREEEARLAQLREIEAAKKLRLRQEAEARIHAEEERRFQVRKRESEAKKAADDALQLRREELEARHQALVHGEGVRSTHEAKFLASSIHPGAHVGGAHDAHHVTEEEEELRMRLEIEEQVKAAYEKKWEDHAQSAQHAEMLHQKHHEEAKKMAEIEVHGSRDAIEAAVRAQLARELGLEEEHLIDAALADDGAHGSTGDGADAASSHDNGGNSDNDETAV